MPHARGGQLRVRLSLGTCRMEGPVLYPPLALPRGAPACSSTPLCKGALGSPACLPISQRLPHGCTPRCGFICPDLKKANQPSMPLQTMMDIVSLCYDTVALQEASPCPTPHYPPRLPLWTFSDMPEVLRRCPIPETGAHANCLPCSPQHYHLLSDPLYPPPYPCAICN